MVIHKYNGEAQICQAAALLPMSFTWSSHQSHNFFCVSTLRAFGCGSVGRAQAVRYWGRKLVLHSRADAVLDAGEHTPPLMSPASGAAPAYREVIAPWEPAISIPFMSGSSPVSRLVTASSARSRACVLKSVRPLLSSVTKETSPQEIT